MNIKFRGWLIWISTWLIILLAVSLLSLCVGSGNIPLKSIFPSILGDKNTTEYSILMSIRLPRIILGFAIGGALSLAGVLLQGMFRNPLVEPYTLGISGGAALGVCLNIVFRLQGMLGILTLPFCGFLGAAAVILFIYGVSIRKGVLQIQGFLLTGVMISFIASSFIMLIMALSRSGDLQRIVFWIMGSLEEPSWALIQLTLGVSLSGLVISYFFCHDLNAFSLGQEQALHLGINIEKTKRVLFIIASAMVGCSVSVAGIIGFVGLVVPHFVRMFVGGDHRVLLISSFLCGAGFLILCDTLARTIISPLELPVGVITGILGGSLFIYALAKKQTA